MAGWSSRNKYSLLGAMRAVAQMVSYEVPLISCISHGHHGSQFLINRRDRRKTGRLLPEFFPHWYVFTPWGFAGFLLFMVAATAESNRSPIRPCQKVSRRLSRGYFTEYSGFKFALFFPGGISWNVCHQRTGNHAVSWWMVCAVFFSDVGFHRIFGFFAKLLVMIVMFYMGSRYFATACGWIN